MTLDWLTEDLPTPNELKRSVPISVAESLFVQKTRDQIINILEGTDHRKLLIVGPCSIHEIDGALEYAKKLKQLSLEVSEHFLIVMRVYAEKPRTALGWKGFMHDPKLDGSHHIEEGLLATRKLMQAITSLEMPIATEFLDPASPCYLSDFVSWGCVGARTASSQIHRQIASHLPLPIGFKNSTEGNVEVAVNGIEVASIPQTFIGLNGNGRLSVISSFGNSHAHLVLRGGEKGPNYTPDHVLKALTLLKNKRLIIDCSHDNSRKKHFNQTAVFESVIDQITEGTPIVGIMLESYLEAGQQPLNPFNPLKYGVSITDACLDFTTTENLILNGCKKLETCVNSSSSSLASS